MKHKYLILISIIVTATSNADGYEYITDKDLFVHMNLGYSKSQDAKGEYDDNFNNSMLFDVGTKLEVLHKVKIGLTLEHRDSFKYDKVLPDNIRYTQDLKVTTLISSISYDLFTIKRKITPYVEAGLGISRLQLGKMHAEESEESGGRSYDFQGGIEYQPVLYVGVGTSFHMYKNLYSDINYRYIDFGKIKSTVILFSDSHERQTGKVCAHELLLSIRFKV